jgi:hypothetical protein
MLQCSPEFLFSGQPQSDCDGIFRKVKWAFEHSLTKWRTIRIATAIVIDDLVIAEEGIQLMPMEKLHNDFSLMNRYWPANHMLFSSQKKRSKVHF